MGPHLVALRGYSWLCTQESLLSVLGGPYGMPGIEPTSASHVPGKCQANALFAVLWPLEFLCAGSFPDSAQATKKKGNVNVKPQGLTDLHI